MHHNEIYKQTTSALNQQVQTQAPDQHEKEDNLTHSSPECRPKKLRPTHRLRMAPQHSGKRSARKAPPPTTLPHPLPTANNIGRTRCLPDNLRPTHRLRAAQKQSSGEETASATARCREDWAAT